MSRRRVTARALRALRQDSRTLAVGTGSMVKGTGMNVLVMGAGGVGGYFGSLLARAGHQLSIVARGAHLDAIQSSGLTVQTADGSSFTVPASASDAPKPGEHPDLILFTVKSYDAEDAIARIQPTVGPDTAILTLLNGVGAGRMLAERFGRDRVLDGLAYIESYVKAPGGVAQDGGPCKVVFGRLGGNGEREQSLLSAFEAAGWNVELAPNILTPMWQKLTFIGPFAAVNTLTGLRADTLCASSECKDLVHAMMTEYANVGRADGAELPADTADGTIERMRGFSGLSSMLRDRMAGKRLEVDALVGEVIRRAETHGIPTPVTNAVHSLLMPMASGGAAQLG